MLFWPAHPFLSLPRPPQVRALTEETGRMKVRALEAIHKSEKEEAARRTAEASLKQVGHGG